MPVARTCLIIQALLRTTYSSTPSKGRVTRTGGVRVAGAGWSAVDEAAHEGVEAGDVEGLVLDADDEPVGMGLR